MDFGDLVGKKITGCIYQVVGSKDGENGKGQLRLAIEDAETAIEV